MRWVTDKVCMTRNAHQLGTGAAQPRSQSPGCAGIQVSLFPPDASPDVHVRNTAVSDWGINQHLVISRGMRRAPGSRRKRSPWGWKRISNGEAS